MAKGHIFFSLRNIVRHLDMLDFPSEIYFVLNEQDLDVALIHVIVDLFWQSYAE